MERMSDELITERDGNVLVLRLNRPDARNALSPVLIASIGQSVIDAEADPSIRVLVLTGTGARAFCAGMDLRAFASGETMANRSPEVEAAYYRLIGGRVTVPVVGAANGSAVAGGLELLLGCDVIVASADARFGLPEVKRGLIPAGGGTTIGSRVPLNIAMELILTGDTIDAARAYEIGLVNAVVPAEDVFAAAMSLAARIAANGPLAIKAAKELGHLAVADADRWAARLAEWQPIIFGSDDAREGASAFVEKRAPVWQAR
jgi:enoyl-CoA hydratase